MQLIPNPQAVMGALLNDEGVSVQATNTALDIFTPAEMKYAITHEVAGHIPDYLNAAGNPLDVKTALAQRRAAWQADPTAQHAAEFAADKRYIDMTCDPDTVARTLAKIQANIRHMKLEDFGRLYARGYTRKNGPEETHPDWTDRVKAVREHAKAVCPGGTGKG